MYKKRLFYFPLAGASSLTFKKIKTYFPDDVDAICFDYPGHGQRISESSANSMQELIADAYEKIKSKTATDTEYYLAGHCIGAVVAYEVCRMLQNRDNGSGMPKRLIVSGHGIPSVIVSEGLGQMDDDALIAHLVKNGLTDSSMADPKYRKMVKGMIIDPVKKDSALYDGFIFDPFENIKISCGIDVLYGKEDQRFPEEDLKKWSGFTSADVTFKGFEGGHYFLMEKEKEYFSAMADIMAKGDI